MSKILKTFFMLAAVAATGALAANTTTFYFSYPQYLYVYTNLDLESFLFDKEEAGSNPGTYETEYGVATKPNLLTCLQKLSVPTPVTAQDTPGSQLIATGKCDFVATDTEKNDDFKVDWGSTGEKPDGALMVLTNASDWTASVEMTTPFGDINDMVALQVRTDENTLNEVIAGDKIKVGSKSGTSMTNAYYTQYRNAYVIPLQYVMVLSNPFSIPKVEDKAQVTYTVSSP